MQEEKQANDRSQDRKTKQDKKSGAAFTEKLSRFWFSQKERFPSPQTAAKESAPDPTPAAEEARDSLVAPSSETASNLAREVAEDTAAGAAASAPAQETPEGTAPSEAADGEHESAPKNPQARKKKIKDPEALFAEASLAAQRFAREEDDLLGQRWNEHRSRREKKRRAKEERQQREGKGKTDGLRRRLYAGLSGIRRESAPTSADDSQGAAGGSAAQTEQHKTFGESGKLLSKRPPLVNARKMNEESRSISEAVQELESRHLARLKAEEEKRLAEKRKHGLRISSSGSRSREARRRRENAVARQMQRLRQSVKLPNSAAFADSPNEAAAKFRDPLKRSRRVTLWFVLLFVAVLISLAALLPQFYIDEVQIEGCKYLKQDDIRRAVAMKPGTHFLRTINGGLEELLQLRDKKVEDCLKERFAYIRNVEAQFVFPSRFVVKIEESRELAYLKLPTGFAMIDANGKVLQIRSGNTLPGIPYIDGFHLESVAIGKTIPAEDRRGLDLALSAIDALLRADQDNHDNASIFSMLESVTIMEGQKIYLNFKGIQPDRLFRVKLSPDADYIREIYWLRNAVRIGAFTNLSDGYLDLSSRHRIYVRLKDNYRGLMRASDEIFSGKAKQGPELGEKESKPAETKSPEDAIPEIPDENAANPSKDPFGNPVPANKEKSSDAAFELPNIDQVTVPTQPGGDELFKNLH